MAEFKVYVSAPTSVWGVITVEAEDESSARCAARRAVSGFWDGWQHSDGNYVNASEIHASTED
jgi:hypothetical protein